MSIDARLKELEQRAARMAADTVAGAVELPDDWAARDLAERLTARVSQLPQPAEPTARAMTLTILGDMEAIDLANDLARRLAVLEDEKRNPPPYVPAMTPERT
jgi:hypothetical protein